MKSIFLERENNLHWHFDANRCELLAGGEVLAAMTRESETIQRARAQTQEGVWMLQRDASIKPLVTVFRGQEREKFGLFLQRHGPQRRLLLLDGTLFTWKPAYERGRHVWKFLDSEDQCLFFLSLVQADTLTAVVELLPFARNVTVLPLLLTLGWFEVWMEIEDAARPKSSANA